MTLDRTERQNEGIEKWVKNGCRGTLQWATGTGKTRAGLVAITRFFNKNPDKKVNVFKVKVSFYLKLIVKF
jgi:superfamily II DNA or RNA helicase